MYRKFFPGKLLGVGLGLVAAIFLAAPQVLAHVTVKPSEAQIGKFTDLIVSVPVERDVPTVGLRLVLPAGLQHVTPNVKPGWKIELKNIESMKGEVLNTGQLAPLAEIIWTGGVIPPGQRDTFSFSVQMPVEEVKLVWKAYQTYEDGVVAAWDQDPNIQQEHDDAGDEHADSAPEPGPWSETKVIDDLQTAASDGVITEAGNSGSFNLPLILSVIAVVVAAASFLKNRKG